MENSDGELVQYSAGFCRANECRRRERERVRVRDKDRKQQVKRVDLDALCGE